MKKHLLMKTLLVALVCLVGGASSVWADKTYMTTMTGQLGLSDNSTPAWTYYTKTATIKAGETYTYTFQNFTKGSSATAEYQTWIAEIREETSGYCLDARGDGGGWIWDGNPTTNTLVYNYAGKAWDEGGRSLSDFMTAYNNVTVTLTISCSNDGKVVTIARTATLNGDTDFSGTWTCSNFAGHDKTINLIAEASHLNITNVHANTTTAEKNYALLNVDHTASSSRNGSNAITTTVDAENEHYNNSKAAAWGGWAYAQFSYTIPVGYSVESATLTWSTTIIGNSGTRNNDIYYVNAGTTIDYASLTSSTNLNPDATFIVQVQKTGPATHTGIETDVSSAVRTIASTQNYIIFKWTNNAAGADLHGKTSANAPTLELVTTAETFYTATFNANGGALSPSVTVYSDAGRTSPIAKDALSANTTYYYRAVLAGYENYEGSFDVETSDPVVNFTMTAKTQYNYTVNAVDGGDNILASNIVSGTCFASESTSFYLPSCVLVDGTLYFKQAEASYKSETVTENNQVFSYPYTTSSVDNVVFYVEGENISGASTSTPTGNQQLASKGYMGRGSNLTLTTLPVGVYTIYVKYINTNSGAHTLLVKAGDTNVINADDVTVRPTKSGSITLTEPATITLTAPASSTSGVDYLYIVKTGVPVTVTPAGYATYVSGNNLDFTSTAIKAYTAKVNGASKSVVLTQINKVPAGTPVILYKEGGATENVPVATTTDTPAENDLIAGTGAAVATDGGAGKINYILNNVSGIGFYKAAGQTVAANRAYLQTTVDAAAARMTMIFEDDDVTSISEELRVKSEEFAPAAEFYDLQGRKVAQPQKGLYIVNGKKVVLK